MISNPAKTDKSIGIFIVLKNIITNIVEIIDNINDKYIGVFKKLRLVFLDHFESTEKNKKNDASRTIGMNIAL